MTRRLWRCLVRSPISCNYTLPSFTHRCQLFARKSHVTFKSYPLSREKPEQIHWVVFCHYCPFQSFVLPGSCRSIFHTATITQKMNNPPIHSVPLPISIPFALSVKQFLTILFQSQPVAVTLCCLFRFHLFHSETEYMNALRLSHTQKLSIF